MANVPSFRFSFRGNICRNHPFGNHPFVNTKKGHWEIKGRFPKGWFWRTYPRSGFRSGGTSAKTTLLETTLSQPPSLDRKLKRFAIAISDALRSWAITSATEVQRRWLHGRHMCRDGALVARRQQNDWLASQQARRGLCLSTVLAPSTL